MSCPPAVRECWRRPGTSTTQLRTFRWPLTPHDGLKSDDWRNDATNTCVSESRCDGHCKGKRVLCRLPGAQPPGLDPGWVVRLSTPVAKAVIRLVTRDATASENSAISVAVGNDVDRAYDEAVRRRYEIVHPLTDEPWGLRRFLVRAPDGNVINITSHSDD